MKRKLYALLLAVCMVFITVLSFNSCFSEEPSGIVEARINDDGELIVVYQDGSEKSLGRVVGQDGADGKDGASGKDGSDGADGKDGKDGIDGIDGIDGNDGASGSVTIVTNGSSIPSATAKGLRSAVSIVCNFTATVQGGYWPGSGTTTKQYASAGSGVIYKLDKASGDAFIITNYHVVYDASSNTSNGISNDINVFLYGSEYEELAIEATYVGGSLYYDIAVLRVEDSDLIKESDVTAVEVFDSDNIVVGDTAIAIGNAQGYGISASYGIISVDSEYLTMTAADGKTEVTFRTIRIDTAVNPGNSGGGIYDDEGKLIGIVNAKIVEDDVENIAYAIPSKIAVNVAENIIDNCFGKSNQRVLRAMLGISLSTSDSRAVYDPATGFVALNETVEIYEVEKGSLADGKLEKEDVLVSVVLNGQTLTITRQHHIIDLMLAVRVGDVITLTVLRDGTAVAVNIEITESSLIEY